MPNGLLYRWEDHNHGLEHKCGTCATVLSSPRAKKTCFGIHEEVCTRYHKTLFYVGQSHHCDACHKSIEQHDKRHRQIIAIVQAIQRLDTDLSPLIDKKRKDKKKPNPRIDLPDLDADTFTTLDEQLGIDWDNQSGTLIDEDAEERAQVWEDTDARKVAKAERKTAKNQVRFEVITKEDLDRIQDALHPEIKAAAEEASQGQGLFDNNTIDQNIGFNAHTFKYSKLRQGVHAKKVLKNNGQRDEVMDMKQVDDISTSILNALGIKTQLTKASKERKNLDSKLRSAIMNDLVAYENEQAETMQRMAGYWRYVNRRTYNQMVENNELWDWATGQKLLQVEEETELDTIEEEDESTEADILDGTTPSTSPTSSPESWDDDEDFEFPAEGTPLFAQNPIFEDEDGLKTPTQATYARHSMDTEEFTELSRKQFDKLHLTKPTTFSPGRSPGPTLTFRVPSPTFDDDDPYDTDWDDTDSPILKATTLPTLAIPIPLSVSNSISPITPATKRRLFDGEKDTRNLSNALFIRSASPPADASPCPSASTPTTPWYHTHRRNPSPTTIPPTNRYDNLNRELPAPCDDIKKPSPEKEDPFPPMPNIQGKVIKLDLPPKIEDEEGWEPVGGSRVVKKNNKNFPKLGGGGKKGGKKSSAGAGVGASYAKVVAGGSGRKR